jgi:hypothetical protein
MEKASTISTYHHKKGLRVIAEIASYVFHPVFMPTVMTLVVAYLSQVDFAGVDFKEKVQWTGIMAELTLFYPLFSILLMKALGFVDSIRLKTSKDRIIPLIATMIFYFWAYRVFKNFHAPFILLVLLLGNFWGIIVVFMANIFIKISMHTAAAGGMLGILTVLMFVGHVNLFIPFLITLLIAGIIGTARMILQQHSPMEIWLGYAAGIAVQIGAYWYLS